jgi:hypothetical protein
MLTAGGLVVMAYLGSCWEYGKGAGVAAHRGQVRHLRVGSHDE